jgi:hypothetical protein
MSRTLLGVLCFVAGLGLGAIAGFLGGVWSTKAGKAFLEDLATDEQPADVGRKQSLARPGFTLDYPGNWKLDVEDEDHDPDHLFSIESPGSCHVTFTMLELEHDAAGNVETQIEALVPQLIKDPRRAPFDRWGDYAGVGVKLEGKVLGFLPGSVRVFSHSQEEPARSFTVVESCFDEDMAAVGPGFRLIETSFKLRP